MRDVTGKMDREHSERVRDIERATSGLTVGRIAFEHPIDRAGFIRQANAIARPCLQDVLTPAEWQRVVDVLGSQFDDRLLAMSERLQAALLAL